MHVCDLDNSSKTTRYDFKFKWSFATVSEFLTLTLVFVCDCDMGKMEFVVDMD